MLPDLSFSHIIVVGLIALIVVGPKDLPMLMRRVGQFVGRMRGIANEFRASFDDMARQSELDDLRREVEALRTGKPIEDRDPEMARRSDITDIYSPPGAPASADAYAMAPTEGTARATPPIDENDIYALSPVAQTTESETPAPANGARTFRSRAAASGGPAAPPPAAGEPGQTPAQVSGAGE
jgi:sec-independent protein translocase protein TatB